MCMPQEETDSSPDLGFEITKPALGDKTYSSKAAHPNYSPQGILLMTRQLNVWALLSQACHTLEPVKVTIVGNTSAVSVSSAPKVRARK